MLERCCQRPRPWAGQCTSDEFVAVGAYFPPRCVRRFASASEWPLCGHVASWNSRSWFPLEGPLRIECVGHTSDWTERGLEALVFIIACESLVCGSPWLTVAWLCVLEYLNRCPP